MNFAKRVKGTVSILAIVCFVISGLTISYATENPPSSNDTTEIYFQMGQLEQAYPLQENTLDEAFAFVGDTIAVNSQELALLTARKTLVDIPDAEEKSAQYLLRREALYNLALKNDYSVSDNQVYDRIQMMKDAYANEEAIGRENIVALINGTGMSSDEYWDSQFDLYKKEMTIDKYASDMKKDYANTTRIKKFTQEDEAAWQDALSQIAEDYISQDNLKDLR